MRILIPAGSTRNWRALAAGLAVLLWCSAGPTSAPAKPPPPAPLYWGAQIGRQFTGIQAPWDMRAVYRFERLARKKVSVVSFSAPFADCSGSQCTLNSFPTTPMEDVRQHGAIPFFSWNSASNSGGVNQPDFRLSDVIDGRYDSYIRSFAEAARAWGHPFFLRFDWEMNGFWFPWSEGVNGNRPGQFVSAWRHVHDIFTSVGATNATWVWCPNIDFTRKLTPLQPLYPGSAYVDWTCLDGFNWGDTANSAGWQSFNQVFHSTYRRVLRIAPDKPVFIGEVASDERGGSKPAWIRNLLRVVPSRYRKVRGLIWFDEKDQGMRWPIESSHTATRAFAKGISRAVYRPNIYGELATSPLLPPTW